MTRRIAVHFLETKFSRDNDLKYARFRSCVRKGQGVLATVRTAVGCVLSSMRYPPTAPRFSVTRHRPRTERWGRSTLDGGWPSTTPAGFPFDRTATKISLPESSPPSCALGERAPLALRIAPLLCLRGPPHIALHPVFSFTIFPIFELGKLWFSDVIGADMAMQYRFPVVLVVSAATTMIAALGLVPFEAVKIRLISAPENFYKRRARGRGPFAADARAPANPDDARAEANRRDPGSPDDGISRADPLLPSGPAPAPVFELQGSGSSVPVAVSTDRGIGDPAAVGSDAVAAGPHLILTSSGNAGDVTSAAPPPELMDIVDMFRKVLVLPRGRCRSAPERCCSQPRAPPHNPRGHHAFKGLTT